MESSHPEQGRIEFGAPPEQLLTARQVAKRLQVSVGWVTAHASSKHKPVLPSFKLGKSVRFRSAEVDAPSLSTHYGYDRPVHRAEATPRVGERLD
jgi:predicted DNA-binding transcriptional regulator AlpA